MCRFEERELTFFLIIVRWVHMVSDNVKELISMALAEDIGTGDVTTEYFVSSELRAKAVMAAREEGVLSGVTVAAEVFKSVDPELNVQILLEDGDRVSRNAIIMVVEGSARSLLTAERTALNFIQRLSGVASETRRYVDMISHTQCRILDTRKTTPGFRLLQKAAVCHGGGTNHRLGLYDRAMVKDNHLMTAGDLSVLQDSIDRVKADKPGVEVQLEVDNLDQFRAFLTLRGVDHILLDNMSPESMREAVALRGGHSRPFLEASGGISRETLVAAAESGVDFISVGALTHSAPSLDLGLDFKVEC